jgi:hypothetical protein
LRKLICAALLVASSYSYAGFITGMVVGSAMSSGNTTTEAGGSSVVVSDKNDIISCCKANYKQECIADRSDISPAVYAGLQGYKTLHKVGVLARTRGCDMIIMEVSK